MIVEERILEMIGHSLHSKPRRTSLLAALRMRVYIYLLRRPIRVPAPIEALKPHGNQSFEQLKQRWQVCQSAWANYLNDKSLDRSRALFKHPLGGWFNLTQTAQFVIEHLKHHHFQLTRIESSITLDS